MQLAAAVALMLLLIFFVQHSSDSKMFNGPDDPKKLAPYGTGGRLLLTANSSHLTQKLGQK